MSYDVSRCTDYDLVREICLDPEMLHRISDDFFEIDKYRPENDGIWLRCDREGVCVGIVKVNIVSRLDLSIHIHIPKRYRSSCLMIGNAFVSFLEENKGGYLKLSTRIAEKYGNVIRFTKRLGFEVYGVDRLSYQRDGKIYDTVMMSYIFKE